MTSDDTPGTTGVHLLVPLKPLARAKSRLLAGRGSAGHVELVTAMALDTVAAARRARGVAEVVVVSSDRALTEAFTGLGVEVVPDDPGDGLNAALRHGDRTAIIDERGSLTFQEVEDRANAAANALIARGVKAGDGVAILARNHRGFLDATFGCAKVGARMIFLNTDFAGPQIREVAGRYGVIYKKTRGGDVDHTFLTSLIDRGGTLRVQYMGVRFDADELLRDLQGLSKEGKRR